MIFRAGHSTVMRTKLVLSADYTATASWVEDRNLHYELAADIEPIPVYRRVGNFGCHIIVGDIESHANSSRAAPFGNWANTAWNLVPVVYTLDEDNNLRPMFDITDPALTPPNGNSFAIQEIFRFESRALAYFAVRIPYVRSKIFHYAILPSTDEAATGYDPIDDVTFPVLYPGLIAKIGFAWVHSGPAGANVTASVRIRGAIEMTVP